MREAENEAALLRLSCIFDIPKKGGVNVWLKRLQRRLIR